MHSKMPLARVVILSLETGLTKSQKLNTASKLQINFLPNFPLNDKKGDKMKKLFDDCC